jgi:hypothetical protein
MPTPTANLTYKPQPPRVRLCLGITGHREDNAAFAANRTAIEAQLTHILDVIAATVAEEHTLPGGGAAATRLHCLLADGVDQIAASQALARQWELVVPLPFGQALNAVINAPAQTTNDALALLSGNSSDLAQCSEEVRERASRIHALAAQAHVFALADRDDFITALLLEKLADPTDPRKAAAFAAESSLRAALAGRVMVEQSDLLIAVWDGVSRAYIGGTGHTIQIALETGAPVVWIDANAPAQWQILVGPEELAAVQLQGAAATPITAMAEAARLAELQARVRSALRPALTRKSAHHKKHQQAAGPDTLAAEQLRPHSNAFWHLYRRVEAMFGADTFKARFRNLRQTYEAPEVIGTGSAAPLLAHARALSGQQETFVTAVESGILRRFAWADGVSARLSDLYRGGMTTNFLLAPLAIVIGIGYLPFASSNEKWLFAVIELLLLGAIVYITMIGQRHRWHGRWFETRRVAEYLRHAPILLTLGVARAPGRWPQGTETSWPEWYARHTLREVGLPQLAVTQDYLRNAVRDLLHPHVVGQRDYHLGKAHRLATVHHRLDHLSEVLFTLALVSVSSYLILRGGDALHLWPHMPDWLSYFFTFLGVLLPTFGGSIAGIRYFGDFERFSAISSVTAEKLHNVHLRIEQLLHASTSALDYGHVSDLAHASDDVVVSEIENWQAVFGGKQVTVPV